MLANKAPPNMSEMGTGFITHLYLGTHSPPGWTPSMQGRLDQGSILVQRLFHEVLLYGGFLGIETFPSGGSREAPDAKGNKSGQIKLGKLRRSAPRGAVYKDLNNCWVRDSDLELKGRAFSDCLAD